MQRRLLERWPPWVAIGFTALCFALEHLEMHAGIFSLPPGIWLGWVAWKTNSLWPGIVSHIAALGCWALTACFMHLTGVEAVPHWLTLFAVVVAFAVTLWAVWILQTHFGPAKAAVLLQD